MQRAVFACLAVLMAQRVSAQPEASRPAPSSVVTMMNPWSPCAVLLYQADGSTVPLKAERATYRFHVPSSSQPSTDFRRNVMVFFNPATGHVWAGRDVDYYVETPHGTVGIWLSPGGVRSFDSAMKQIESKEVLDGLVDRYRREKGYFKLLDGPAQETNLRRWVELEFFEPFPMGAAPPILAKVLRMQVKEGQLHLGLESPTGAYHASCDIGLETRQVVRAENEGKSVVTMPPATSPARAGGETGPAADESNESLYGNPVLVKSESKESDSAKPLWAAATTRPVPLTERAERVAAALPWLVADDAFVDRELRGPNPDEVYRLISSLQGDWTPDDVRPLLHHADPRVRTLGIVLLFSLERLDVLPDIARLTGDDAKTFPEPENISDLRAAKDWPMQPKTVGDYAKAAINMYVDASYELHQLEESEKLALGKPAELAEQMPRFAARRDVKWSTAGLRVAMSRATGGGTQPLPPERLPRVREVLSHLQHVPEPRRFFVALALNYDRYQLGDDYEAGEDYLFESAQRLPREVRLASVKGERPVDDPDLEPGFGYEYLLDHAVDLFHESDADLLLKGGPTAPPGTVPKGPDPRYVVAAAALRPRDADAILEAGLGRFNQKYQADERASLCTALALTGSERGLGRAIEWFFAEPRGANSSLCRFFFLRRVHARDPLRFRLLVSRVVRDDRVMTLGPQSTLILLKSVEGYLGRRLATDEDLRTWPWRASAGTAPLARWQRLLHDTVNEWDR